MNRKYNLIIIVLFMILFVNSTIGCRSSNPIPVGITSTETSTQGGENTTTVSDDRGAFHVVVLFSKNEKPIIDQPFYLAEMRPVEGQLEGSYVPILDLNTAPNGVSDENGNISISNVVPGKFALILYIPTGPVIVIDSQTKKEVTFDVSAGQVTNLDTIKLTIDPESVGQ